MLVGVDLFQYASGKNAKYLHLVYFFLKCIKYMRSCRCNVHSGNLGTDIREKRSLYKVSFMLSLLKHENT